MHEHVGLSDMQSCMFVVAAGAHERPRPKSASNGQKRPTRATSQSITLWIRFFSGNQNCTKKGGGSGSNVISVTCVKPRRWAVLLRYENLRNQAKGQTPPQLGPSKLHRSQNDKRCKNGAETVQFSECRRICFRDSVRYWWRQASRRS